MHHRMTITLEDSVYQGLKRMIAPRHRSQFIEDAIRPLLSEDELEASYRALAEDEEHNAEAREWTEAMIGDSHVDPW